MSQELKYLATYRNREFKELFAKRADYTDRNYMDWLYENKVPPGMMEIYSQYMFGAVMGQTFPALFIFEWLLNFYPVEYIVELGTGTGGLTMFLQFQANVRNLNFVTYDAKHRFRDKKNNYPANRSDNVGTFVKDFRQVNVFDERVVEEIRAILKEHVVMLYCDNGNKPREAQTYFPFARKGSVLGVHDWSGHFGLEEIEKEFGLKVIWEDLCREGLTKMRWWIKEK